MSDFHPALRPGNVAVITGGASEIGLAVARKLGSIGLRLCLVDRDEAALQSAATSLGGAMIAAMDVAEKSWLESLVADVAARLGPVSVLMNNAGTGVFPRRILRLFMSRFRRLSWQSCSAKKRY